MLVTMLFCALAISISATEFESLFGVDVTAYEQGPDWANIDDNSSTAVLKKADDSFVRVPAYCVFKANNNQFKVDGSNFDFGWISEQLGEEITLANLVAFEIPHGTKSISGAVQHKIFTALEELVIPTSITSLGQSMFRNNNVLRKIFVKQTMDADGNVQGVTTLPGWFADITDGSVSRLESFDFELDYLTSIGANAFMNSAIKSFKVKAPITSFGGTAFSGCKQLETVELINTGAPIGMGSKAFAYCTNLKSVVLENFSTLPAYLFEGANGLQGGLSVTATGVTTMGEMVFKNAANLTSVTITGPLTSISSSMFLGCTYLENVSITNTLKTPVAAGNSMCDRLKNLKSVTMHGVSIGGYSFREIAGSDMKVTLTNVGSVGESAFYKASNITELYIEGPLTSIGKSTYRECAKLEKLTVINTGETYVLIGNGESNPVLKELHIEGKIDVKDTPVFQNNVSLKHVYLGEGVREIGPNAFYKCYALETMYLADTITVIGDRAIDMDGNGRQTSESFMFVDKDGNMDNTLPTSLTKIDGHFLKCIKIANTQLIFPESFTYHNSTQAYDFENTILPEGFSLVYLGKMTAINLHKFYEHNGSKDVTVYLANNTASDIKNYRVNANVATDGTISHGSYAGINPDGTLEIIIDSRLHNNINPTAYIKFVFCSSDEICFVTRVNIVWGENTSSSWGNFVSTPVTYEQLAAAYAKEGKTAPASHPMTSAPEYSDATCTEPGGVKTYCLACGNIATVEKTEDAKGHMLDCDKGAIILSIAYVSYDKTGTKIVQCATCKEGCEETAEPIFTPLGSSSKIFGEGAVSIGYIVNRNALGELKSTGVDFGFGVYVVSQAKLGENDIFTDDGAVDGAFAHELTSIIHDVFELKLLGFTEEQADVKFAMGAYTVVTEGENKTYSYLQLGDAAEGEKYSFVTYNSLMN